MVDNRIQLAYVAGIALNGLALVLTARAGDWLVTVTFAVIVVYLLFRYRMSGDA